MYTIGNTAYRINKNGFSGIDFNTPNQLVCSPFGNLFYLAGFDEELFKEDKATDQIETVN